jgi:hypothetical protein
MQDPVQAFSGSNGSNYSINSRSNHYSMHQGYQIRSDRLILNIEGGKYQLEAAKELITSAFLMHIFRYYMQKNR